MTDQQTSTVINDNLLMSLFSRKAIKTLHESVVLYQLADKYPLPPASGKSMTFNGFRKIGAPSSTLSEYHASANSAVALSSRKVSATVSSYGRWTKISTDLEDTSIIPVIENAVRELTQSAKLGLDNVLQMAAFGKVLEHIVAPKAVILSAWMSSHTSGFCKATRANHGAGQGSTTDAWGFPVVFGTSATRLSAICASAASISARMGPIAVRRAVSKLQRLAARPMSDGTFTLVTSPHAIASMFGNPAYQTYIVNYAQGPQESVFPGEIKHLIHGCRVVVSPNMPVYKKAAAASALSASLSLILGEGALAVTELGNGLEFYIKRSGESSTNDPLDMLRTVGYKFRAAGAVLDPSSGVILITVDDGRYSA